MARRRFAVAVVIPQPVAFQIDGLRRALGDRQLGRIDPHVTVIPPINLHDEELTDALVVVEQAASHVGRFEVEIGPVETFGPTSPVRFLRVEPWAPFEDLYRRCWQGVFERPEKRSFHPHVTVDIDGSPTDAPDPAIDLLGGYSATVDIDRVTVLEHIDGGDHRRWESYLSYPLQGSGS